MDLEDAVREDPDTQGCVGAHVGERPRGDRKQRSKERWKKRPIEQDFYFSFLENNENLPGTEHLAARLRSLYPYIRVPGFSSQPPLPTPAPVQADPGRHPRGGPGSISLVLT